MWSHVEKSTATNSEDSGGRLRNEWVGRSGWMNIQFRGRKQELIRSSKTRSLTTSAKPVQFQFQSSLVQSSPVPPSPPISSLPGCCLAKLRIDTHTLSHTHRQTDWSHTLMELLVHQISGYHVRRKDKFIAVESSVGGAKLDWSGLVGKVEGMGWIGGESCGLTYLLQYRRQGKGDSQWMDWHCTSGRGRS